VERRTVTKSDQHALDCILRWVWSGFYTFVEIDRLLDGVIAPDCNVLMLRTSIASEIERKRGAEATWPAKTDCDKLDRVFLDLHERGICALSNTGDDLAGGLAEVRETLANSPPDVYRAWCYYHRGDVAQALDGGGLHLAFGAANDSAATSVGFGRTIVELLRGAGLLATWSGAAGDRIALPAFIWQRRSPE
jgi:hypothetical protein